jgi:hypothetical protein
LTYAFFITLLVMAFSSYIMFMIIVVVMSFMGVSTPTEAIVFMFAFITIREIGVSGVTRITFVSDYVRFA